MPVTIPHQLLTSVAGGDEKAFKELFHLYKQRIYSYAMHFTDDAAVSEEIVQEVFLKLWLHKKDLTGVERFEAWLYTITRNRCFDYLKKMAHERALKLEWSRSSPVSFESTEHTVVYKDYENIVHRALNCLTPKQKLIYTLSRLEGQKYEDIAKQLHISRNTVKVHLVKALDTIRHYLENHLEIMVIIMATFPFLR